MAIKAYLRLCMLLICLSTLSTNLSAQITETTVNESVAGTGHAIGSADFEIIALPDDSLMPPITTRSCVNTFTNQTVSTFLVVNGCSTLVVQDVTVSSSGDLYLLAPGEITINGAFEVVLGGQLNVQIQPPCVNSFINQTVSAYLEVVACSTLVVQDVNVTSIGDLLLSAPGEITINGAFEVILGGQLNIGLASPPPPPPPPSGNTMQIAINIGTFGSPFQYTDTKNTAVDYTNDYVGQPTNDVFYVFTLTTAMNITIKHCDSAIGTFVHLLNSSGANIANNGGYNGAGACANTAHAYLKQYLAPGTYYIVSEGYSANGSIKTSVAGDLSQPGFEYAYDASGNRTARTYVP